MLAMIAGRGELPACVAAAREGLLICAMAGSPPDVVKPDVTFRLEQLGGFLSDLRARGVRDVCFAGAVQRPILDPTAVDADTRPLLERIVGALRAGDDGALRTMLALFEEAGFAVRAAQEIAPDLVPEEGVLTQVKPRDEDGADAGRAEAIVAALGAVDVGQACVVARGQALAVEALPGTDAMLATLAARPAGLPMGGLLYKAPKPRQDRRVDLPTIGPATVAGAARAGLAGIVVAAGGVIVLDRSTTVADADAAGLFLWVRRAGLA